MVKIIPMFAQVFETWECRSGEMHIGDVWRPPPNFREIRGGRGDVEVIKIINPGNNNSFRVNIV